ncbi:MAG: hypothetical protein V3W41_05910 [Planctomycetota bacterium]
MKRPDSIAIPISLVLLAVTVLTAPALAQRKSPTGQLAPKWEIEKWIQLPEKTKALDIGDFKGKTIYLYTFQAW